MAPSRLHVGQIIDEERGSTSTAEYPRRYSPIWIPNDTDPQQGAQVLEGLSQAGAGMRRSD